MINRRAKIAIITTVSIALGLLAVLDVLSYTDWFALVMSNAIFRKMYCALVPMIIGIGFFKIRKHIITESIQSRFLKILCFQLKIGQYGALVFFIMMLIMA